MGYPEKRTAFADQMEFTVTTGQSVRAGMPVKLLATNTAGDDNVPDAQEAAADTDVAIAIADGKPGTTYAAGDRFSGWLISSTVLHMLVGTAGITRGARVVSASDGIKDAAAHGTTSRIYSHGIALSTSVVGDTAAVLSAPLALSRA